MLLLHDQLIDQPATLSADNRAFRYGDGFFETIIWTGGELRYWPQHWARIRRGADVLQLDLPTNFETRLPELLAGLVAAQGLAAGTARVRWQCWRDGAGLYTPLTNRATWLATAEARPRADDDPTGGRADWAETVRTAPSVLSFLKGPNAALYTLAALEKRARGLDELLLLSPDGYVAEATTAGLLWVKGDTLFTPDPAATGAVAGVRLAAVLAQLRAAGWSAQTGCFRPAELLAADAVATISVTGIRWLQAVAGNPLGSPPKALLEALVPTVSKP